MQIENPYNSINPIMNNGEKIINSGKKKKSFRIQDINLYLRISLTYIVIFTCFIIILFEIHFVQKDQKDDANIVDVAGRNRMLSQKLAFVTERIFNGEEAAKEDALKIIAILDGSLKALKEGGVAPEMPYILPATEKQEILPEINNAETKWANFKNLAKTVINEPLYINSLNQILSSNNSEIENSISTQDQKIKNPVVADAIRKIHANSDQILNVFNELTKCYTADSFVKQNHFSNILWLLAFVILFITIFFIIQTKKYVIGPLREINIISDAIALGDLSGKVKYHGEDEMGQISKSINNLSHNQSKVKEFAEEIGKGNLQHNFAPLSEFDTLGNSLLQMRNQLLEVSTEQEQRSWANQGLAKFADMLRRNNNNIEKLSDEIIMNLVHYTKANQGGFFLYSDEDPENIHLKLIACYAFNRKKYADKIIALKEGLVGTCAIEKQMIYLTEIPDDYIKITSGLGDSNPRSIIIIPLKLEETIFGVIELASFNKLEAYEIQFLEKIAESIASTLSTVKINIKTQDLLVKTQKAEQQLYEQEEELRQNLEEMQATQDEMAKKEIELTGQLGAINKTNAMAEYDLDGTIIKVNSIFCDLVKYNKDQILNKKHELLCNSEFLDTTIYNRFWDKLKNNIYQEGEYIKISSKGDTIYTRATYFPITDNNSIPYKVMELAIDITPQKKLLIEAQQKTEEIKAQQEEMLQNIEEMTSIKEELERKDIDQKQEIESLLKANNNKLVELKNMQEEQLKSEQVIKTLYEKEIDEMFHLWYKHLNEIEGKYFINSIQN